MPRGDGSGPAGTGRGLGQGRGSMQGNRPGFGPAGNCICPSCGKKIAHTRGVPCFSIVCPECGVKMMRE